MKKPAISLCVIFRNNEDTISDLLRSVHGHFDELVFVDTGCTDKTRERVRVYFKNNPRTKTKLLDFEWVDDFAKARNFCFKAATGDWRMFLDTDDVLVNGQNLRALVTRLETQHPEGGAVFLPYDYNKDEHIETLRLVKWLDGNWNWHDAIHERIQYDGSLKCGFIRSQDVSVQHRRKSPEEYQDALLRNARIATREHTLTQDPEYKARLARTMAMGHVVEGNIDACVPLWEETYRVLPTTEIGRKAAADLSRYASLHEKDPEKALRYAKAAGPSYVAMAAYLNKDWDTVIDQQVKALQITGHQTTHEGFAIEKQTATAALAESLFRTKHNYLGIANTVSKIRPDFRLDTQLKPALDAMRAMGDLITILVPNTPQPFSGHTDHNKVMLGGSEQAVLFLARELAARGRVVRVFCPLPPQDLPGKCDSGVYWDRIENFNIQDEHGFLVIWRSGQTLFSILEHVKKTIDTPEAVTGFTGGSLWLHDYSFGVQGPTALALCKALDNVICLSENHKRQIIRELGADPGNILVLSNGVNMHDFPTPEAWSERNPNRVVYSSCPTRGLEVLLWMWPEVKAQCPDAVLDIYYTWDPIRMHQPALYQRLVQKCEELAPLGVTYHGGVGHKVLNEALLNANVWAYSHFTNTEIETSCISAMKASLAGATVLTTRYGALPETVPEAEFCATPVEYRARLIDLIQNPKSKESRAALAEKYASKCGWDAVAEKFDYAWSVNPQKILNRAVVLGIEAPKVSE